MPDSNATQPQSPQGAEQPKIIIDDDWKAQAKAEKERLAHEVEAKQKAAPAPAPAPGPAGPATPQELPPPNFPTLVSMLLTQAFMALGGMEDRRNGRRYVDLDLGKHYIDMLSVLEEKTRGNLADDEKRLLDQALYEGRMQYVAIAQQSSPMPEE